MDAYLASTQLTQVNKITSSCEICNGPLDTHNCMEGPEQAYVDYASSHANEIRGKSYQIKLEKALLDFDSNQDKRLSHLRTQIKQQRDDMIGKINLLWKIIFEKLNDASPPKNAGNSMAPKSIEVISYDEKEELRKKGIKIPSIFLSLKYLSPASIKELNKNPSSPKRICFVNSIIILSTDSDTEEEDDSSTNACGLNLGGMVKEKEEVKEKGKEEDEMETKIEVEEVSKKEESEFETNEEVKEIFKEEEEDEDNENFNSFPTMKELSHHEWLLKNPRPPKNKRPKDFHRKLHLQMRFMILEDTTSIIDHHLGEMVFGRPFIEETGLKTLAMEGRTTTKALIGDEYKQDGGDRRGIEHLMRLEKEMIDNKGEVT
ncbi:hypothetical protein Tco_1174828 [Tanacetum coccineum]